MLKEIRLINFQGVTFNIELNEKSTVLFGTNRTGKTRVGNAFLWAWTGKDLKGRSNFEIFKVVDNNETDEDCSVELIYTDFEIKRTYKRNIKKGVVVGNTTDYFIDDFNIVVKESEFNNFVKETFGSLQNFTLLSNLAEFSEMDWQKRRDLVFSITGKLSDIELLKKLNLQLNRIPEILKKGSLSETIKRIGKSVRVGEKELAILNTTRKERETRKNSIDLDVNIAAKITETKRLIESNQSNIANINSGNKLTNKKSDLMAEKNDFFVNMQKEIYEHEQEKQSRINLSAKEMNDKNIIIQKEINILKENKTNTQNSIDKEKSKLNELMLVRSRNKIKEDRKKELEKKIEKLKAERQKEREIVFSSENCFYCGSELQQDKIEELKGDFNEKQVEKISEITKKGKEARAEINAIIFEAEIVVEKEINKSIEMLEKGISSIDDMLKTKKLLNTPEKVNNYDIDKKIDAINLKIENFDTSDIDKKIEDVEKEITTEKETVEQRKQPFLEKAKELEKQLSELVEIKAKEKFKKEAQKLLNEVVAEIKEKSGVVAEQKGMLSELKEFVIQKASYLETDIYNMFGVKFKMIKHLKNGEIEECCEVLTKCDLNYIPYSATNTESQINVGLKICEVLQKHYKIDLPVFVDRSESVVNRNFIDVDLQTVRLTVNDDYPTLTKGE